MSETSKVISEVKLPSEALTCPLCDSHYDLSSHQPKILPCFHTFCGECLDKELSKGDTLSCPNCRRVTPVPPGRARGFSSNFALMTLLGQVPEVTGGTINCDICAEPAGFRCVECEQFMCEEDKKRHLKFAMSRDHHVEPLSADQIAASSSVPAICSTHNLEMRYLCTKDDTVICTDCFAYSHHGHPCLPIGEAFEAEQGQIAKLVEDATAKANKYRSAAEEVDSTIKAVTEVERRVESEIRLHFEKVRDAVTARELKLLSILQTITKQKETTLTEQREILSSTDVSISTSCAQIQELLKQNSKASCLMMKRQALANLEAIAKVNTPCDPEVTADVHFIADEKLPLMISGTGLVSEVSTSPAHTHATGDGILAGRPNQLMTIEVFAKDSKGKPREVGGDVFVIEAKDYKLESKVIDKKDGSYIATFTCPEDVKEELLVSILLRGKHISGSPFHVHIFKEIEGKFVRKWGSYGVSDGQLNGPIAIAVDKNYVYVSDHCNDQIQIFTREGILVRKLGGKGSSNGEFAYPWGVQVDDEACVYVADHRNKRIQVFAKDGAFLRAWPTEGTCAGIGIHGGFLYVGENSNHQIHVYTKGGTFVRSWGTSGTEDGQFASPYAVTVDDLYVYVGDRDNHRVQVFTKDGNFIRKWGSYGTGDGLFNGPIGIVVDGEFVYVSDQNHRVQVFNKEGKFVRKWGTGGAGDGQFLNAFGIAIDQGLAYLADYSNHRIQVFK